MLAVGAAELGAGVRVWVLVPADVAEVAPAERRRLLAAVTLVVGLHGRGLRCAGGWQGRGWRPGGASKWVWEVRVAGGVVRVNKTQRCSLASPPLPWRLNGHFTAAQLPLQRPLCAGPLLSPF